MVFDESATCAEKLGKMLTPVTLTKRVWRGTVEVMMSMVEVVQPEPVYSLGSSY